MWTRFSISRYVRGWKMRGERTMQTSSTNPSQRAKLPDLKYNENLFNYTRGRFVRDEEYETSQRRIHFDVNELARCAAEAIGAEFCTSIEKFPDGMYNKSMLLTMNNGSQVVAKVPNPNAGIPYFTTASEVATMDFARNILGTPVPKVLAWSSKAKENPVGAEYIIMEKVQGIELERVWNTMDVTDRFSVVKALAGFEKSWTSVSFKKLGSLYYSNDVDGTHDVEPLYTDADGIDMKERRFVVGPSTEREFFDEGRATIDLDRGPWCSLQQYHTAIGHREISCISQLPQLPRSEISLHGPGTYLPTREKKLKALDCYLKLIEFLLPTDPAIKSNHLWHTDLHTGNIFVNPSQPTEIVGLIDWQCTHIAPLYFCARQPEIINYEGPRVRGLERPERPSNMDGLDDVSRACAEITYLQGSLCSLYNHLICETNPKLFAALEFGETIHYMLLLLARNILIDGEAHYLAEVTNLEDAWDAIPGAKGSVYPFSFSAKEKEDIRADAKGATLAMDLLRSVRECIGDLFPEQGYVKPEQYDEALDALQQMKDQVIDMYAKTEAEKEVWQKMWPFGT